MLTSAPSSFRPPSPSADTCRRGGTGSPHGRGSLSPLWSSALTGRSQEPARPPCCSRLPSCLPRAPPRRAQPASARSRFRRFLTRHRSRSPFYDQQISLPWFGPTLCPRRRAHAALVRAARRFVVPKPRANTFDRRQRPRRRRRRILRHPWNRADGPAADARARVQGATGAIALQTTRRLPDRTTRRAVRRTPLVLTSCRPGSAKRSVCPLPLSTPLPPPPPSTQLCSAPYLLPFLLLFASSSSQLVVVDRLVVPLLLQPLIRPRRRPRPPPHNTAPNLAPRLRLVLDPFRRLRQLNKDRPSDPPLSLFDGHSPPSPPPPPNHVQPSQHAARA